MSVVDAILRGGDRAFAWGADLLQGIPFVDSYFLNIGGLISAFILIPFILLYLIRPKPHKRKIPSLMFLMRDKGTSIIKSFFRNLVQDIFFFLQLLIFLILIAAIAQPFLQVPEITVDKDTVIVLDASASMSAQGRFADAKDIALDSLSSRNTVILAGKIPETILIKESKGKAKEVLSTTDLRDTETNLYDSIVAATQYLDDEGRIFVISDFADDTQYETAIKTVESLGYEVYLRQVGQTGSNVGIIDLDVKEQRTVITIKNYNSGEETVRLSVNDRLIDTKSIPPRSSDIFTIETPSSVSRIDIDVDDDFPLDDTVHISAPEEYTIPVLIVTNNEDIRDDDFLIALDAINSNSSTRLAYDINTPPQVPEVYHDLIIFKDVDPDLIIPGTVKDARDRAAEGGGVIIMAQDRLFEIDWLDMLGVTFVTEETEGLVFASQAQFTLTDNVNFGTVGRYFIVKADSAITPVATVGETPIISLNKVGKGTAVYYGIFDRSSDFSKEPYYPIFWKRLIDQLSGRPDIKNLNYETGRILNLNREQKVKTPTDTFTTSSLFLKDAGIYTTEDRVIVANMLSDTESDIQPRVTDEVQTRMDEQTSIRQEKMDVTMYLVFAALALLLIELIALKVRGDL